MSKRILHPAVLAIILLTLFGVIITLRISQTLNEKVDIRYLSVPEARKFHRACLRSGGTVVNPRKLPYGDMEITCLGGDKEKRDE